MNMDMQNLKRVMTHIAQAGCVGFVLGGLVGVGTYGSDHEHERRRQSDAIEIDTDSLRLDTIFFDAVFALRPYRKVAADASKRLFDSIVRSSNDIVSYYLKLKDSECANPGVLSFRMHRFLREIRESIAALGRLCTHHAAQNIVEFSTVVEFEAIARSIDTCADNYIQNSILTDVYK